ncbi:MAG: 2-dehydropantoate 2-reductase [Lentisphaeria bacterium]|nr:2-dehydropantoate 2-reductase [Lentisphaeria bacterium]
MEFCIIGAGAMGSLYGGGLAASGHQVTLIDTRPEVVDAINRDGLRLDGIGGDRRIAVAAATPDSAAGPADYVLVHVDTNNTLAAAQCAQQLVGDDSCAITIQNGIGNVEALSDALGKHRVLGGISYNSVTNTAPGHATHTNAGQTLIGELDGARTDRVQLLYEALAGAGFETVISDNIIGVIWNKWIHNCAINPIAAITGLLAGEIAGNPAADELQNHLLSEILDVVHAKGIILADENPQEEIKETSAKVMIKPSMLQHMEQGRRTEIDSQNGAVVREGQALGIPTPWNHAVTLMVKARNAHRS